MNNQRLDPHEQLLSQEKAVVEKLVPRFNDAMAKHHTWHKMNKNPDTNKYYPAKCTGKLAKRLVEKVVANNGQFGWLDSIGFKDTQWVMATKAIWRTWSRVMVIGRKLKPSKGEQQEFGPLCRRLFRCVLINVSVGRHALSMPRALHVIEVNVCVFLF